MITPWNWPKEIPEFKLMAEKIERIARMLSYQFLYRFENVLGLPKGKFVENHIDGSSTMRILHYPQYEGEIKKNQVRGGAHTDYGSITLLWRFDDIPGLQVFDKESDDGTMARRGDLEKFAQKHDLKIGTIADLIHYRNTSERSINLVDKTKIESEEGEFELLANFDTAHFFIEEVHIGPV